MEKKIYHVISKYVLAKHEAQLYEKVVIAPHLTSEALRPSSRFEDFEPGFSQKILLT